MKQIHVFVNLNRNVFNYYYYSLLATCKVEERRSAASVNGDLQNQLRAVIQEVRSAHRIHFLHALPQRKFSTKSELKIIIIDFLLLISFFKV